jgi:hypothetical protein
VSAGLEEARSLARRALELLFSKYVGSLTEEELERLEEEGRLRWAVEKAFLPPPWLRSPREGAERGLETRVSRKAIEKELKTKIPVSPSLLKDLALLALKLAERGYLARVRVIRVRDLKPAKLLPPFLLKPLSEKIVRLELEVYPLTSPRAHSYL